ncbi:hypothetical protein IMZ48_15875, partial [Candidatus Bathyarchaeota archaeon]|nr:hypothetical protein [Candidatus Bathyarchaeota archaeon]
TVPRGVTDGSGTITTAVFSTVYQTLTFVDPGLSTQTNTLTLTAAPPAQRRARQAAMESGLSSSDDVQPKSGVVGNAAGEDGASATRAIDAGEEERGNALTATTTLELPTTVVGIVTITSTVIHTEFVTVTLAPNATATKVTTTTVQPTPGEPDDLPSELPPPQDEDRPGNPSVTSEAPDASIPSATPNPTEVRSRAPSVTDIPSSTSTYPDDPESMQPDADPSATNDPARPIEGSSLTADEVSGLALGIIFGVLFLMLAGFLVYGLLRKRRDARLLQNHLELSSRSESRSERSSPVPSSVLSSSTRDRPRPPAANNSAATSPSEDDVRIVIRPVPNRRTQSSSILPSETSRTESTGSEVGTGGQWPRPPGYSGRPYSFFIESGSAEDAGWSVAVEQGSREGASDGTATATSRAGEGGGGGGMCLGVGRALSPWKVP